MAHCTHWLWLSACHVTSSADLCMRYISLDNLSICLKYKGAASQQARGLTGPETGMRNAAEKNTRQEKKKNLNLWNPEMIWLVMHIPVLAVCVTLKHQGHHAMYFFSTVVCKWRLQSALPTPPTKYAKVKLPQPAIAAAVAPTNWHLTTTTTKPTM